MISFFQTATCHHGKSESLRNHTSIPSAPFCGHQYVRTLRRSIDQIAYQLDRRVFAGLAHFILPFAGGGGA
jgi:hypothetical protein